MAVKFEDKLHPGSAAVAAEFQNIELISVPAAEPANAEPRKYADCSRTLKPPAYAASVASEVAPTIKNPHSVAPANVGMVRILSPRWLRT
jgi:hypothetical protein